MELIENIGGILVKKVLLTLLLVPFLIGGYSINTQAAEITETEDSNVIETPKDYMNYLEDNINNNSMEDDEKESAKEVLDQFKELSKEDQEKFVNYMNDPDVAQEVFEADNSPLAETEGNVDEDGEETTSLYDGDVEVTKEVNVSPQINTMSAYSLAKASAAKIVTHKATYRSIHRLMGINVLTTQSYVRYYSDGKKVTKILDAGGVVIKNWYPAIRLNKSEKKPYINSAKTRAYETVIWEWNFVHKSLGLVMGTREQRVYGTYNGYQGGTDILIK